MRSSPLFPTLLLALLLSACGGPDPAKVLADAQVHFTTAEAAVGRGEWAAARAAWLAGSAVLAPHAALVADGRTLAQHREQAAAALAAQLTTATPRLLADAERDRPTWLAVQQLIATCGPAPLQDTWSREGNAISERQDAAEAAARRAAEAAEAARRSQAYLCWVAAGSETKQREVGEWRATLAKQLSTTFAPVEVIMLAAKPATREGLGSIAIQLEWDHVAYGGGVGAGMGIAFDRDKVPVDLDATMTVTTWAKPGSRDGEQHWKLHQEAPQQVGQYGVQSLASKHRRELLAALDKNLAALPPLSDGAELIEAAKTYVPPAKQATWTCTVTSRTRSDMPNNPMGVHGFDSVGKELAEVLRDHWGIIDLKDATEAPGASGTVTIAIETYEETFGSGNRHTIQTVNGTLPTRMSATVTIKPAAGTTVNWKATTAWTAREPAPEQLDKNNLDAQVVRSTQALTRQLAARIRAEPKLVLEQRPAQ